MGSPNLQERRRHDRSDVGCALLDPQQSSSLGPEDLQGALAVVLQDFDLSDVPEADIELAIADRVAPLNMQHMPEPASWYVEGERRFLLKVASSVTDVSAGDLEEFKASVASHLQDFVVDETGRPWPERVIEGSSRVLDVGLDDRGRAAWIHADRTVAPIGRLHDS